MPIGGSGFWMAVGSRVGEGSLFIVEPEPAPVSHRKGPDSLSALAVTSVREKRAAPNPERGQIAVTSITAVTADFPSVLRPQNYEAGKGKQRDHSHQQKYFMEARRRQRLVLPRD